MISKALDDLTRGLKLYNIWSHQAVYDITAKYKRTVLGTLWLSGSMVTYSVCLSIIFGALMHVDLRTLLPHIMGGILCYGMITFIFSSATEIFHKNANTIKNHAQPYSIYVFTMLMEQFLIFLNNTAIYYICMIIIGAASIPHWSIIFGLPIVLITSFFWGTVTALAATRFRDLRFMMPHLAQLVFYLSPIMWRIDQISPENAAIASLNPFYGLLEIIRSPLMGKMAPAICWNTALVMMFSGIVVWLFAFSAFRKRIPFWV